MRANLSFSPFLEIFSFREYKVLDGFRVDKLY